MADVKFECPQCSQHIRAPDDMAGIIILCPTCSHKLTIPAQSTLKPVVQAPDRADRTMHGRKTERLSVAAADEPATVEATCWQWIAPAGNGGVAAEIKFSCPVCAQHIGAPQDMAGETLSCPNCDQFIQIPALDGALRRPRTVVQTVRQAASPTASDDTGVGRPRFAGIERISYFGITDGGRVREVNEDAHLCLPASGLFAVADGMGGLAEGRQASETVVEALRTAFDRANGGSGDLLTEEERLIVALRNANRLLLDRAARRGRASGSTVAVLYFEHAHQPRARILHAGDSRVYRFRGQELELLTKDHTLAGVFATDEKSLPSAFRNKLLRAVGIRPDLEVESAPAEILPDDIYLLCTDGLNRMLTHAQIARALREETPKGLSAAGRALIRLAMDAGGEDNITVIIIRLQAEQRAAG